MSGFTLKFLTRQSCSLCDQARPLVDKAARRVGASLHEIDVDSSEGLRTEFGSRIPVLLAPDGTVVAEGRIDDPRGLRRAIRRSARTAR